MVARSEREGGGGRETEKERERFQIVERQTERHLRRERVLLHYHANNCPRPDTAAIKVISHGLVCRLIGREREILKNCVREIERKLGRDCVKSISLFFCVST